MKLRANPGQVVLIAHSLGCLAVAWWATLADRDLQKKIAGALLVAPPDVESIDAKPVIQRFAPAPRIVFSFPAILIASSDDPYATLDRSRLIARRWGAEFHDAGPLGHINADSQLGDWPEGQSVLDRLLSQKKSPKRESVQSPEGGRPRLLGH